MRDQRLEIRVEAEFLERIDEARGIAPRSRWIERAIENALIEVEVGRKLRELSGPPSESVQKFIDEVGLKPGQSATVPVRAQRAPSVVDIDPVLKDPKKFAVAMAKPQRHEFASGGEWQAAVRAWKERRDAGEV